MTTTDIARLRIVASLAWPWRLLSRVSVSRELIFRKRATWYSV